MRLDELDSLRNVLGRLSWRRWVSIMSSPDWSVNAGDSIGGESVAVAVAVAVAVTVAEAVAEVEAVEAAAALS